MNIMQIKTTKNQYREGNSEGKNEECENVKYKRCENVKKINAAFENPKKTNCHYS